MYHALFPKFSIHRRDMPIPLRITPINAQFIQITSLDHLYKSLKGKSVYIPAILNFGLHQIPALAPWP